MFCYETSENAVRGSFSGFDPSRVNASAQYLKHYENRLYLEFMVEKGTLAEKHQAKKELAMCDRKLAYWERQPNFNSKTVLEKKRGLHANWNLTRHG